MSNELVNSPVPIVRGFEFTYEYLERFYGLNKDGKNFPEGVFSLPKRSTEKSAGYDFQAVEYTTIPSVWKQAFKYFQNKLFSGGKEVGEELFKPTLVETGVKAYMQDDEYLELLNRSSNPLKRFLVLANGVGVIDADYYGNPDNDGHIMFQFLNFGIRDVVIKPGEKIGQGIFHKYLTIDHDEATGERVGGFGSTNE